VERWAERYSNSNLALTCGSVVVGIDIDELDRGRADALQWLTFAFLGETPLIRYGRRPKRVLVYGVDRGPIRYSKVEQVEILGDGRYFVAMGDHPETRCPYFWPKFSPVEFAAQDLPKATPERIEALKRAISIFYGKEEEQAAPPSVSRVDTGAASKHPRICRITLKARSATAATRT
jgi:hypothetical protein